MPRVAHIALAFGLLVSACAQRTNPEPSPADSKTVSGAHFRPTGEMTTPRQGHLAVRMHDGSVLIVGGLKNYRSGRERAEIYDPAAGLFHVTGSMGFVNWPTNASLLNDGRVLVYGSHERWASGSGNTPVTSFGAEIFDPKSGRFVDAGRMNDDRDSPSDSVLADGSVLFAGGFFVGGNHSNDRIFTNSAELYIPASREFVRTGAMKMARWRHSATLLRDGRVMIAGGERLGTPLATIELYDPARRTFMLTGKMTQPRSGHAAALLPDGKVLLVGGQPSSELSAEIYDPTSGRSDTVDIDQQVRRRLGSDRGVDLSATSLGDGAVLLVGAARAKPNRTATAAMYAAKTGRVSIIDEQITVRDSHSSTLLANGTVLIAGGVDENLPAGQDELATAELFVP